MLLSRMLAGSLPVAALDLCAREPRPSMGSLPWSTLGCSRWVRRTRRVLTMEGRYYGRTARLFNVGVVNQPGDAPTVVCINDLSIAAAESMPVHRADDLRSIIHHARIPRERAREFWEQVVVLMQEFAQLPREGDTVYGFVTGPYPTDHPSLPEPGRDA